MREFLIDYLKDKIGEEEFYYFDYEESVNEDALTDKWLENQTSYIYKVAVSTAIDSNKFDFAHIAIGVQRSNVSQPEIKGYFYFSEGENDDIGRVIGRAVNILKEMHPIFEDN